MMSTGEFIRLFSAATCVVAVAVFIKEDGTYDSKLLSVTQRTLSKSIQHQSSIMPQVFFITGTSSGFGNELVKKCLSEGDIVVATARNSSKLSFDNTTKDNFLAIDCDVTDTSSVDKAFEKAVSQFSRVDVVVNNAGYGLSGEFESVSESQIRTQMEVNFFGVINVTRKALEVMREKYVTPIRPYPQTASKYRSCFS